MKFLVLGSGLMGSALAFDLARSKNVEKVTLADADLLRAEQTAHKIGSPTVVPMNLDVTMIDSVVDAMKRHDCVISAVSYRYNFILTKAAIAARVHFCDLGGNDEVVNHQLSLGEEARKANVLIVPNCGLAPGMANVLAARGAELFESLDSVKIRVGGLPQHPRPPFNYQLVFSVEGLINEYSGTSTVIRNGKMTQVDTLTEVETMEFPEPPGTLEAFHTSGGSSLLPSMFEGKVHHLDYKTLRYPGHCEKFKALLDLGFASNEPITIGSNLLTAKEFFFELLKRKLDSGGKDLVVLRIRITGRREGRRQALTFELIDFYDEIDNITAMMRATSFPTSIIAHMIVEGNITARGVVAPELFVPLDPFVTELAKRNIRITQSWMEIAG